MKPVRIKYYGLIPLTKRTYLFLQVPVLLVGLVLLAWALSLPPSPRFGLDDARLNPLARWVLDHLAWIVLTALVLEILDTIFTLRTFSRKEGAAQASEPVP